MFDDLLARFSERHHPSDAALHELHTMLSSAWDAGHAAATGVTDDRGVAATGASRPSQEVTSDRYEDRGLLGVGGMGEVRRVHDRTLHRTVAMKLLRPDRAADPGTRERFLDEARATAQLQHPGIVAVHELGTLPDGRLYFTMKEIRGRSFASLLDERGGFARELTAFHAACTAVAYAHSRGVLHRDLKPHNIMVGEFGDVVVVDWGLAKIRGGEQPSVVTGRSDNDATATAVGAVLGTPTYMAPEQARGDTHRLDARTDVYALGAILYQILTGRPPYRGGSALEVLALVRQGPPPPVSPRPEIASPEGLIAVCERAMAREPRERFPTAAALAETLQAWIDGSEKEARALELVTQARSRWPRVDALRAEAATLRARAEVLLESVADWEDETRKSEGWALEDRAHTLERDAALAAVEHVQLLNAALTQAPGLPDAHTALAELYLEEHAQAENAGEHEACARAEVLLRSHLQALAGDNPVALRASAYLVGDGAVSLVTDPPGAEVVAYRYVTHRRRLVPELHAHLGRTPLVRQSLPQGSYLLSLSHPEAASPPWPALGEGPAGLPYPVHILRQGHWDGVHPVTGEAEPVLLPARGSLGPDDCVVLAGMFLCGEDSGAPNLPVQRRWCDGFVLRRFVVTHRRYLEFLNDMLARGHEEEVMAWAPREGTGNVGSVGPVIYPRQGSGLGFPDLDRWDPEQPAIYVDSDGAEAFARWEAENTGRPWRICGELEWEKAARGVDGRRFPWGDFVDPSWLCCNRSHRGAPSPAQVDTFPIDCSPYGVRGMAGNVRQWCMPVADAQGAVATHAPGRPVVRGGAWSVVPRYGRGAQRDQAVRGYRHTAIGFRIARSFDGGDEAARPQHVRPRAGSST